MKRLFLSFAFITALLTSCVTDSSEVTNQGGEVKVTIGIDIPELATRSGETAMNSGLGAIDNFNFDGSEWDLYDVRYMLEVYDVTEGFENLDTPIKQRYTNIHGEYEPTNFEIHLIPNRDYRFVVWADFVAEGTNTDLHYNTADLKAITRTSAAVAMDECQDAYFIQKDLRVNVGGLSESLTLKRPFGKIRVITTDHDEANLGSEPAKVEVKFYNHKLFTSLNAVTGEASGETLNEYTYEVTKETSPYTQGYDGYAQNMTLFADYILAGDDTVGAQEVNFTMTVWGKDNREIRTHDFNTQIPLERNHLTTIVGNLLTTANDISITIDDDFDGEYINDWGKDAINIANGDWGYGTINANGNYEFLISDGANYFTLIAPASAVDSTGKLALISEAEYVASEAELVDGTFTIRDLMVDPTRAAEAATVKSGTMNVSGWTDGWTDGVYVQLDLYYTFDAEAAPAEYHNIRYQYTGEVYGEVPGTILEIVKHDIAWNSGGEIEYNFYVNDYEYYRFDFFNGQTNDDGSTKMIPGTYTLVPDTSIDTGRDIFGTYSFTHNGDHFTSATIVVTELEDGRFQFDAQFMVEGDATLYKFTYTEAQQGTQDGGYKIYVDTAAANWEQCGIWIWNLNTMESYTGGVWPGVLIENTEEIDGVTYYVYQTDASMKDLQIGIVLNNWQASEQTVDIKPITLNQDVFITLTSTNENGQWMCDTNIEHTYSISRTWEYIDMVKGDDGWYYANDIEMSTTTQFQLIVDQNPYQSYYSDNTLVVGDNNVNLSNSYSYLNIDYGIYNFAFNPETSVLRVEKTGDVELSYILSFESFWMDNEMEKGDDGLYKVEGLRVETNGNFRILVNWDWSNVYGNGGIQVEEGDNQFALDNTYAYIEYGVYNFTFDPESAILNIEKVGDIEPVYRLSGAAFDWNNYDLIKGVDGLYRIENIEINQDNWFQVLYSIDPNTAYGLGFENTKMAVVGDNKLTNDYSLIPIRAGVYNFAFNPDTEILNIEKVRDIEVTYGLTDGYGSWNSNIYFELGDDGLYHIYETQIKKSESVQWICNDSVGLSYGNGGNYLMEGENQLKPESHLAIKAGTYNLTFDPNTLILTVETLNIEPEVDIYSVIGDFTVGSWDTDIELVDNGNGVLVARDVEFANANNEGCVFKIRKNYTWVYNWGANTPNAFGLNTEINLIPDSSYNIKVDAEVGKTYDIYVNLGSMCAWVEE